MEVAKGACGSAVLPGFSFFNWEEMSSSPGEIMECGIIPDQLKNHCNILIVEKGKLTLQEWEVQHVLYVQWALHCETGHLRAPTSPGFSTWALGGHTLTRCDWLKLSADSFPFRKTVCKHGMCSW